MTFLKGGLRFQTALMVSCLCLNVKRKVPAAAERFGGGIGKQVNEICPCRIVGAGRDMCFRVFGADGVQALQLSFAVIDGAMAGKGLRLLWDGEAFGGFTAAAF